MLEGCLVVPNSDPIVWNLQMAYKILEKNKEKMMNSTKS